MSGFEPTPELPDKKPTREVRFPLRIKNALFAAGLKTSERCAKQRMRRCWLSRFGKASIALLRETLGLPSTDGVRPLGKKSAE